MWDVPLPRIAALPQTALDMAAAAASSSDYDYDYVVIGGGSGALRATDLLPPSCIRGRDVANCQGESVPTS